jgi:FtsP/CotA-like multicopper oxidase with cupredoxin domain
MRTSSRWIVAALLLLAVGVAEARVHPESAPRTAEPWPDVPELVSRDGVLDLTLTLAYADLEIGGQKVRLRTYNGALVGPTLRVRPGDTLRVRLVNALPCPAGQDCDPAKCQKNPCDGGAEQGHAGHHAAAWTVPPASVFNSTNLHLHGLHVSPSCNSDNVLLDIGPGCEFQFEFKIPANHPAGTYWYHPHVHGATAIQVSSGAVGSLIVEGDFDRVPGMPGQLSERNLLFQQIPYKCNLKKAGDWKCKAGQTGVVEDFGQQVVFGKWDDSGRFTSINGAVQPEIRMRPGEVQRWRLIHGGVRETLMVAVGEKSGRDRFKAVPGWLRVIALDGLATGGIKEQREVELQPGYRVDVLVRAPEKPGTYYLLDEPSDPLLRVRDALHSLAASLEAVPQEPRKVLAVIQVGETPACSDPKAPCHREMPEAAQLARFRLPSVTDEEIAGRQPQKVFFDIDIKSKPFKFQVCGKTFDAAVPPRSLELGKADEWIVGSSLIAGHPFHIHVNPFEVIDDKTGERYWKDTILIKPGHKVRLRTRYETYDGDFVLHCHILDHEDQGMMQLVRIAPGPQPVYDCPMH